MTALALPEPPRLFRLLCKRPRPSLRIETLGFGVEVVAPTPYELAAIDDSESDAHAATTRAASLLAASCYYNGRPAFASHDDVLRLPSVDFDKLYNAVDAALLIVAPNKRTLDQHPKYLDLLKAGAKDNSNATIAARMAAANIYVPFAKKPIGDPSQYFGMPLCELTTGQLLAFDAARGELKT